MVAAHPEIPVIAVTEQPDTGQWIDALEQGAVDYCSAPFEEGEVIWTLATALRLPHDAAS